MAKVAQNLAAISRRLAASRSDHPAASAPWPKIVVFAGVVVDYGLGPATHPVLARSCPARLERREFII